MTDVRHCCADKPLAPRSASNDGMRWLQAKLTIGSNHRGIQTLRRAAKARNPLGA